MNNKYLLVMYDKGKSPDSRWGTFGSPPEFNEETYQLDDEAGLIYAIAEFKERNPDGQISVYIIEDLEWGTEKYDYLIDLVISGEKKAEEISKKKEETEKLRLKKIQDINDERVRKAELAELAKLKAKYE